MPAFPSRSSLVPSGALLPSAFKTLMGDLYDAITGVLGTAGTATAAREAMNVALPNYLDNPDGAVYQRTVNITPDDGYMDDRWYALTQTDVITPSQVSNPENGYRYALRMTQVQAVAQRMGRAQIVPGSRTSELRGKTVTFGGRVKLSASANVRIAILAWTGAEDAVTSDVVNNWASSTYTTGNFFASTSLTLVGTTSAAMTAATAGTVSVSGTVPAGATNLIVLYWTEAAAAQNVTLDAWAMRLVDAATLVDYIRRSEEEEFARCQRFFQRHMVALRAYAAAASAFYSSALWFPVQMRAVPTVLASTAGTVHANVALSQFTEMTADQGRFELQSVAAGDMYVTGRIYDFAAEL